MQLQTEMRARILALMKARGVDQAGFAAGIGRSQSWASGYFNRHKSINNINLLKKVARFLGVSVAYLIGEADRRQSEDVAVVVGLFDALDADDRRLVLDLAKSLRERPTSGRRDATEGPDAPN